MGGSNGDCTLQGRTRRTPREEIRHHPRLFGSPLSPSARIRSGLANLRNRLIFLATSKVVLHTHGIAAGNGEGSYEPLESESKTVGLPR